MKNLRKILILMVLALLAGCGSKSGDGDSAHHNHDMGHSDHQDHEHHASMPHDEPTDMSIYHLESRWTTQGGNTIGLQDLEGKVQLLAMVYTTCEYACPRIVADLERIQSALKERGLEKQTHFVLVTIDPEVDTVGQLKKFAADNEMDSDQWTLLNGNEGDILELAALLGVKYKKTSDKDYAHSNIITVLDQQGEVVHQQTGLGNDASQTIAIIEKLAK